MANNNNTNNNELKEYMFLTTDGFVICIHATSYTEAVEKMRA